MTKFFRVTRTALYCGFCLFIIALSGAAARGADAAPTLRVQTTALPHFVFTDDRLVLAFGLEAAFNQKQAQKLQLTVTVATLDREPQKILTIDAAEIPAFGKGDYPLRIPVDFGAFGTPATLRLQTSVIGAEGPDAEASVSEYRLAEVFPAWEADAAADAAIPRSLLPVAVERGHFITADHFPVIIAQPRFDETALRRWQPYYEWLRVKHWWEPASVLLVAENYAVAFHDAVIRELGTATEYLLADDLLALYLAARRAAESDADTALVLLGVSELNDALPVEEFLARIESLVTLLQHGTARRRIYLAGPPPYPARPHLRAQYCQALEKLADRRDCYYVAFAGEEFFITAVAPPASQENYAAAITAQIKSGPGRILWWLLPFAGLSFALYWLRSFSRYAPKKN